MRFAGITGLLLLSLTATAQTPTEGAEAPAAEVAAESDGGGAPVAGGQVAGGAVEQFLDANKAFQEEDFAAAIAGYEALIESGVAGAEVYYNLGNAWLRSGRLGEAIAAYRMAQYLSPRDPDVAANLAFARKSTKDAVAPPGPSSLQRTALFWHYAVGPTEMWWWLAMLNGLFWATLALRIRQVESEWLRWSTWLVGVPLVALAGSAVVRTAAPERVGVVLLEELEVRAGDEDDAVVRFAVHEGTELQIIETRGAWSRVETSAAQGGWVRTEQLRVW